MKKEQQRLDKILEAVSRRIEDEVTSLIGAGFVLADCQKTFVSKEDAFEQLSGKQVVARMDVSGDIEGKGCLLLGVKDAVRLGGTLIMLPDNALDEAVTAERYDEELADSFGEIANIIAGAYTKVFEEMYPQSCRFIRKVHEVIVPVKVNVASEEPVPDQQYYQVATGMKLSDHAMGTLVVLLPAATFGLAQEEEVVEAAAVPEPPPQQTNVPPAPEPVVEAPPVTGQATVQADGKGFDVKKHQKRVNTLLEQCRQKMGTEVGALLGVDVSLANQECRLVGKEDYFLEEASGKQILAYMDVVGELQDKSYLYVGLKDAIFIGGTLIMLPPGELDKAVLDEEFSEDIQDAYGEIANIISGVFTSVFEEQYVKKIRFVKTAIEKILPLKVDTDADTPMPNQAYYMSSASLSMSGRAMGKIQMLFPLSLLQLDGLLQQEQEVAAPAPEAQKGVPVARIDTTVYETVDVLIVSEDAVEAEKIRAVLEQGRLSARLLSFKDNVADYLSGEVKAVFLVMKEVNEKGLAMAIKINSASSLPLIAAGPGWTRSKVISAVKYGVDDILLTPAAEGDIGEKIEAFSVRLAA